MILQTDKRLKEMLNKFGCYFMSILFIANKYLGIELSTSIINDLFKHYEDLGLMSETAFIYKSESIFKELGLNVKYNNRHDPPKYKCSKNEIEILCLKYPSYKHFVVGDGNGNIAYNPMGKTAPGYFLQSKRVFKLL